MSSERPTCASVMELTCIGDGTDVHRWWNWRASVMKLTCIGDETDVHRWWNWRASVMKLTCIGDGTDVHRWWNWRASVMELTCIGDGTDVHRWWIWREYGVDKYNVPWCCLFLHTKLLLNVTLRYKILPMVTQHNCTPTWYTGTPTWYTDTPTWYTDTLNLDHFSTLLHCITVSLAIPIFWTCGYTVTLFHMAVPIFWTCGYTVTPFHVAIPIFGNMRLHHFNTETLTLWARHGNDVIKANDTQLPSFGDFSVADSKWHKQAQFLH